MNDREAIELLERMVRVRSHSGEEGALAELLVTEMTERGLDATIDAAGNAVIRSRGEGPHLALVGHMDTVSGEVPVRIEEGRLYGRGTVDAKGPLAAFLVAAVRLAGHGKQGALGTPTPPPPNLTVIGCVEEEAPSSRGARHVAAEEQADYLIIGEPSGTTAITLGYKGYLRASLTHSKPVCHTAHGEPSIVDDACVAWSSWRTRLDELNRDRSRVFDQILPYLADLTTSTDGLHASVRMEVQLRLPEDIPPAKAEALLGQHFSGWRLEVRGALPAYRGGRTSRLHQQLARAIRYECPDAKPRYLVKTGTADLNIIAPAWNCPALAYGPGDAALDHTPNEHIELSEYLASIRILERCITQLSLEERPTAPSQALR